MFGRVKQWLGIEGVKMELVLPEEIILESGIVDGKIRFSTMHSQTVSSIQVRFVETYKRGRRKQKVSDEYELGKISLEQDIEVPAGELIEIDFVLPFQLAKSEMDQLADKNFLLRGAVSAAKLIKGVASIYRVEAEATVKGTALNPFARETIRVV